MVGHLRDDLRGRVKITDPLEQVQGLGLRQMQQRSGIGHYTSHRPAASAVRKACCPNAHAMSARWNCSASAK